MKDLLPNRRPRRSRPTPDMPAAAGGLALVLVLTAVIPHQRYAVQAVAGYAPYSDASPAT